MTSREEFFKDRVLKTLYQDDEGSSDEEIKKRSLEISSKLNKEQKRTYFGHLEDTKNEDKDWPVPLPKLKRVHTVAVRPEDLQKAAISKSQARDITASKGAPSCSGAPVLQTGDAESSGKAEQKLSKNRKRKLKKKRQKAKDHEEKSREFTY